MPKKQAHRKKTERIPATSWLALRFLMLIFMAFPFFSCTKKAVKVTDSFNAMSTYVTVQVFSSSKDGKNLCAAAKNEILDIERVFSTTLPQSEVFKINHTAENDVQISPQVKNLLDFSGEIHQKTGGLFNPALYPVIFEWGFTTENYSVPTAERIFELMPLCDFSTLEVSQDFVLHKKAGTQLDFGGIAKGYAGDAALDTLARMGATAALVNLGGNVQFFGKKPDGSAWTIGIKNPWTGEPACSLKMSAESTTAVITSGGYERYFTGDDGNRYSHIFDPRTGRPAQTDLESVTVICEKGVYADALSTALFVMGKTAAIEFWQKTMAEESAQENQFDFILMTKDRKILYTDGLNPRLTLLYDFSDATLVTAQ